MSTDSRYVLASRLAQFLRRNGDKVISGSCKLSLTTSALCLLNSLFSETLSQDFRDQTELTDSGIYKIHEDVKYLYDFMKKTSSLKLFHGMQTLRGGVDLSHFSNLTVLELRKIPAHLIIGLNSLSIQLKALICSRSIYLLKELFGSSIDEQNTADVWTELKELNLSYNYLENLDDSIKSLPNVEILDLSHNNISNTEEIQALKRLHVVNLSYNQLETLPSFNSLSCRFLTKLYIRNNNLERLDGLECMFNLEEFDVGYNLLSEYTALAPLDKLKSLKILNLEGNPLYFHKQHAKLILTFIHPCALSKGLRLNGKFILLPQNLTTNAGNFDEVASARRHQTSINTVVGDMQNAIRPPEINPHTLRGMSIINSASSDNEENSGSSYASQNDIEQLIGGRIQPVKQRKKSKTKKLREALINDPVDVYSENNSPSSPAIENDVPSHIKAKLVYETRRKERGQSWLIPDNSFQKLVITPPEVPSNTPVSNSAIVEPLPKDLPLKLQTCLEAQGLESSSSISMENELAEVLDINNEKISHSENDRKRHVSRESDDIEVLATNLQGSSNNVMKVLSSEDLSDYDFYESTGQDSFINDVEDSFQLESDDESEATIFFVERITKVDKQTVNKQTISVNIGPRHAKEKDAITGQVLDKLDLTSLSSVNMVTQGKEEIKSYEIHLEFDTVKSSRQQRLYVFQDFESAQCMYRILQPFADANTLKEATIGALECVKCKSQFSKQVAHRKILKTTKPIKGKEIMPSGYDASKGYIEETDACPNCGNHILVEMESIPLPSIALPPCLTENKTNAAKKSPDDNSDNISVGSSSSGNLFANLFASMKISPMLKRKSVAAQFNDSLGDNSYRSTDTIGTFRNEKEFPNSCDSASQLRRNSSDVTIISNPSQSSIAVIPEPGMENNLNTILERDSQSSLSPPISQSSIHLSNKVGAENKNFENADFGSHTGHVNNSVRTSTNDNDFYSVDESYEGEKEKPFKYSDIVSSDSDVYHSPYKSVGSSKKETSSKIKSVEKVEVNDDDALLQILGEKKIVSYETFLHLDHRLKLHIEFNIFSRDEELNACIQTSIVPLSTGEEFEGVFVLSSRNVYIIKFLSLYSEKLEKNESLEKQVQVLYSGPIHQIKQIKTILGNQGISVACGPAAHVYTLVMRDVDICSTFCNMISEQIAEKNPQFECLTSAKEMLQVLFESVLFPFIETDDMPEILLHQFAFQRENGIAVPVCITLTPEDIFLSRVLYKKQQSCSDLPNMHAYYYTNTNHQKVSDVISLKLEKDLISVEICFLIESSEVHSASWTVEMQNKSAVFSFITALKMPWEELFAVTLPLNMTEANS